MRKVKEFYTERLVGVWKSLEAEQQEVPATHVNSVHLLGTLMLMQAVWFRGLGDTTGSQ